MPKTAPLQTNFSAGELAPVLGMRRDTKQYRDGAKSLLNSRILIGGGSKRRPGSWRLLATVDSRLYTFTINPTTQYGLLFSDGAMFAYSRDPVTGLLTAAGSQGGCPWTGSKFKTMKIVSNGNTIIFTHQDFTHVIVRVGAASWTNFPFPWYTAANGRIHSPHYKVAALSTTITPSALTGAITLATSAGYFVTSHAGKHFRILDREVVITLVTSGITANATVLEPLRPYQDLTVASSASFAIDEVVEGETSAAKGIVLLIPDATSIIVVVSEGLTKFEAEDLIGPNAVTAIASVVDATPVGVRDWTEQLYTNVNGFPLSVEIHRGRILLAGSASLPSGIAGSSLSNVFDFDVGTGGDADGFLETIGDGHGASVIDMFSAEQLLVMTDRGPYYVPETSQNPFRPSSLAFNHFGGTWPCSNVRTQAYDGGAIYVSGSVVIKMSPTGNTTAVWTAQEKSFLCPHLVKTPTDLIICENFGGSPEKYAVFVNSQDGTLAVMQLSEAEEIRNFVPWETEGTYVSGCSAGGQIYMMVRRLINGSPVYWLELFDERLTLDGVTEYANKAAMDAGVLATYPATEVSIVATAEGFARYHLGTYPPVLEDLDLPPPPYQVGFFYDRIIETLPPNIDDSAGNHAGEMMRIIGAYMHVHESARFTARGYTLQAYQTTDPLDAPPPLNTGPLRFSFLNWEIEPTITITQPDPLPLTILGIGTKVAY